MIFSMTGFARQQLQHSCGTLLWELRSVNHRYLDVTLRLPDAFRALESQLREEASKKLQRGKIDAQLSFTPNATTQSNVTLNQEYTQQLLFVHQQLCDLVAQPVAPINSMALLTYPGVVTQAVVDVTALQQPIVQLFTQTLVELQTARKREGTVLTRLILERLQKMTEGVDCISEKMPDILIRQREKLWSRLQEIKQEVDRGRLEQEMVIMAQKIDVAEELDRLRTHIAEGIRVLTEGHVIGRRLDFLMQELHREVNTLGAKSLDANVTQVTIDLKVLIEQMREQVQNIE